MTRGQGDLAGGRALIALALVMALLGGAPAKADDDAKEKLAVLDIVATRVEAGIATTFTELLINEVGKTGKFQVIGKREISQMIDLETEKQMMGCSDDNCLAEIAGALGVDKLLTGNIGRLGQTFLVTLKVIDQKRAKVAARAQRKIKGDEEKFIEAAESMVQELFMGAAPSGKPETPDTPDGPDKAANADKPKAIVPPVEPPGGEVEAQAEVKGGNPLWSKLVGWGLIAVAAGAVAGGTTMTLYSSWDAEEYRDGVIADDDLKATAESEAAAGWALFGVAAATATGGLLLLLLDLGDDAPATTVAPAVSGDGAGFIVTGRW